MLPTCDDINLTEIAKICKNGHVVKLLQSPVFWFGNFAAVKFRTCSCDYYEMSKLATLIVAKVNVDVDGARWKNMMVVAWPLQAKMSQIQLSRHVNRSIECLNRRGNPQLPFLAVNCKRHGWHSVEISWFLHHSDFTWNQFWESTGQFQVQQLISIRV